MTDHARKRIFIIAASMMLALLALFAVLFKAHESPTTEVHHSQVRQQILRSAPTVTRTVSTPVKPQVNIDPEATDPVLRAEHQKFLESRPLEQHLPYRDHEIGADVMNITPSGKLVVLVTYIHSQQAAQRDIDGLMARYHDPGTGYVIRYQPVFK